MQIGFEFTDTGKLFTLYIRRGIGEVRGGLLDSPAFTVSGTEKDFKALASGTAAAARAALLGTLKCSWRSAKAAVFAFNPGPAVRRCGSGGVSEWQSRS